LRDSPKGAFLHKSIHHFNPIISPVMVKEKVYGSFEDFRYHARLRRARQSSPLSLRAFCGAEGVAISILWGHERDCFVASLLAMTTGLSLRGFPKGSLAI
jgi:hypothetical protein